MTATVEGAEAVQQQAEGQNPLDMLFGAVRSVWWVGLGAVALAGEQGARAVKTMAEKGKEVEPQLASPFKRVGEEVGETMEELSGKVKDFGGSLGSGAARIEEIVDQRVAKTLQSVAGPVQKEIQDLNEKVAALEAKIDSLKQGRAGSARKKTAG